MVPTTPIKNNGINVNKLKKKTYVTTSLDASDNIYSRLGDKPIKKLRIERNILKLIGGIYKNTNKPKASITLK